MDGDALLDGLDAAQREAVTNPAAPLAVLAPAGSGKTRVLTGRIVRRVREGDADGRHVLALTFTRRAADELTRRLATAGLRDRPTTGTFHGVALAVLRRRWADVGLRRPPELLSRPERLLAELPEAAGPGRRRVPLSELATEIAWARARLIPPERYEAEAARHRRRPLGTPQAIAGLYAAYEAAKRTRRLLDFDDLLASCTREILRDPAFAELQRWRFRHLFVDEFQDVNPLQHALLEAWRAGRPDLFVVGDPSQAIYGWNGADPAWLAEFAERHPGATVVRLVTSYRSTPQILAVAHGVLAAQTKTVHAAPPPAAVRADGPQPAVHAFSDERAEAAGIASLLRTEHAPGRRWSTSAVLVRTHAQAALLERVLSGAAVPARVRGDQPLLDQAEVRAALGEAARYREPGALRAFVDDLTGEDGETRPSPAITALVALARDLLASDRDASVGSFRAWLAAGGSGDTATGDSVDIVTFHAAKGLEWPTVVVAGLERGLVPHASAATRDGRDEEARLLYVALTRAEHTLHLTWARRRGGAARTPSPLLPVLKGQGAVTAVPPPVDLWDRRPAPVDPVLTALEEWRRHAAVASGLPATAICTDAALAAIAATRPATIEDLAGIPDIGPIAARRLGPRVLEVLGGPQGAATSTITGA